MEKLANLAPSANSDRSKFPPVWMERLGQLHAAVLEWKAIAPAQTLPDL